MVSPRLCCALTLFPFHLRHNSIFATYDSAALKIMPICQSCYNATGQMFYRRRNSRSRSSSMPGQRTAASPPLPVSPERARRTRHRRRLPQFKMAIPLALLELPAAITPACFYTSVTASSYTKISPRAASQPISSLLIAV